MTGSIRIFEKSNFTPKLSVLVFLKVKLPNMTDWHIGKAERQDNVLLNSINFTIDEIEDTLNELHVNKANGPDMIGNILLKNLSKSLPKSHHLLFNLIANKAIFPTKWKISEIAPISKTEINKT